MPAEARGNWRVVVDQSAEVLVARKMLSLAMDLARREQSGLKDLEQMRQERVDLEKIKNPKFGKFAEGMCTCLSKAGKVVWKDWRKRIGKGRMDFDQFEVQVDANQSYNYEEKRKAKN
eukprot:GHVO01032098.1.p1 GENE.GHVO01032098.1~~GHVO01032098.1.p1  ORF type:complete len:118 (+),score=24.00 GHVO01032098.1:296-649(+)